MAWRTATGENEAELSERGEPAGGAQPDAAPPAGLSAQGQPAGGRGRSARRRGLKRLPVAATAKKFWIVLVVAAVVGVAAFCVDRLRGIFGAPETHATSNGIAEDIKPFNPKHVVYEVYGPPGTVADINYLDINAQPRRVDGVPLPWTLSATTTLPSVSVNVVAQGNSDQIGCRIIVNDVVKDERSSNEVNAQTFCIVKSA